MKKVLSIILFTLLLNTILTSTLFAQWTGTGTEADPCQIESRGYLTTLSDNVNSGTKYEGIYFKLMNNIDMDEGYSPDQDSRFIPIGTIDSPFMGHFDGDSKIISNLKVDGDFGEAGLFGYIADGSISNLGLKDVSINSTKNGGYVGGLVGYSDNSTITNCYTTGAVTGTEGTVGGLVGETINGTITNCYATGAVTGTGLFVGGLVGYNYKSTITNCYATGAVTGPNGRVGGLVAYNNKGSITNCYATGSVTGTGGYVGGLVGENHGTITNCYATGSVTGMALVGGLVGMSNSGIITNCYWNTGTSGQAKGVGRGTDSGVTGKTIGEMKAPAFINSLNENQSPMPWTKDYITQNNKGYPILSCQTNNPPSVVFYSITVDSGTADFSSSIAGNVITITAANPEAGKRFKNWASEDITITADSEIKVETSFVMPESDVKITANFETFPYTLLVDSGTIYNGTTKGTFIEGVLVKVIADVREGYEFDKWTTTTGTQITDSSAQITTITMGAFENKIEALFKKVETPIAVKKVRLLSENGTTSEYKPGSSDIIFIQASSDANEAITLKCSGLTYGVDFVISGFAPEGNNFLMNINDLRKGVVVTFLNSGATKARTFKVSLTLPKGWKMEGEKQLTYIVLSSDGSNVNGIVDSKTIIPIGDISKDINAQSTRIVNQDQSGRSGSYSPENGLYYPSKNKSGLGWMDELVDGKGNGVRMYKGKQYAPKEKTSISSDSIPEMSGKTFNKKPAFKTVIFDRFAKKGAKPKKNAISVNKDKTELILKPTVKLYNAKAISEARKSGKMFGSDEYVKNCDSQLGAQMIMTYKDKKAGIMVKDAPVGAVVISAPANLIVDSSYTTKNDTIMRIKGDFLGLKPKAFYEYKDKNGNVKTLSCKVKLYKKDGLDLNKAPINKQFDDNINGYLTMDITLPSLPKGTPQDVVNESKLIIDNGLGYGELKNAMRPKVK